MTSAPRSASSIVAYGPASITPTSRMRIPARGPVIGTLGSSRKRSSVLSALRARAHRYSRLFAQALIGTLGSSRKRSSHLRRQLRNDLPRTIFRCDKFVARLADRQQSYRQVGDTGIGETAEPREDRFFVTGRGQVTDITGVPPIEQLLVVGRRLGLGEDAVGALLRAVDLGVGAQAHRDARDDPRRLAAGVVGGLGDPRRDVVADRALVGHPQHRPV